MFKRLTAAAAAVIAFLVLSGYMALSAYLSAFNLDSHITAFGQYGFIHYGVLMLEQNSDSRPFWFLICVLLLIVYFRFASTSTATPYETIAISKRPMGFLRYLTGGSADERGRQNRAFMSDFAVFLLTGLIFAAGAIMGDGLGAKMANDAIAGVSIVGNPNAHVAQTYLLHVKPGVQLDPSIAAASANHKLGIVWEDDQSIAVLPIGQRLKLPKATLHATTVFKSELSSIDETRTYIIAPVKAVSAKPSLAQSLFSLVFLLVAIAFIIWMLAIAHGSYLNVADADAEIAPITDDDITALRLKHPYAERATYAIAFGKDLRILDADGRNQSVTYVRNSAFAKGFRMTCTAKYASTWEALGAKWQDLRRKRRRRQFGSDAR